jgi:Domain of unknown function (DUF4189)
MMIEPSTLNSLSCSPDTAPDFKSISREHLMKNIFKFLLLGLLFALSDAVHAQCPPGMHAYGTGSGISSCGGDDSAPAALPRSVSYWAAFAIDSRQKLSGSWGYGSSNEAEQSALQSCANGGGEHCLIVDRAFTNNGAVAMDATGAAYLRGSTGSHWGTSGFKESAESNAMKACSEMSKVGGCHLLSGAIYAGSNYGTDKPGNQEAFSMTDAQLLALSRDRSEKKYLSMVATEINSPSGALAAHSSDPNGWGALAYNISWKTGNPGLPLSASHDQPSRESAEQTAFANCPNCKIIQTFSNTCMGIAHPSRDSPFIETAVDADPAAAWREADRQCSQRYGTCTTFTLCSGSQYPDKKPYSPGHPPTSN